MGLDASFIGRAYPPTEPYEVGREKIREFVDAIGDQNPIYRDVAAAKDAGHPDVVAPPTFPVVVSMRAGEAIIRDPDLGLDFSRVVHGEQRFAYARPVRAGDALVAVASVAGIKSMAGNDLLTIKCELSTTEGELVVTVYSTLVARGTAEAS